MTVTEYIINQEEISKNIALHERVNTLFNRDKKVIAARKRYRQEIRNGVPEKIAWGRSKIVYDEVRNYYELQYGI